MFQKGKIVTGPCALIADRQEFVWQHAIVLNKLRQNACLAYSRRKNIDGMSAPNNVRRVKTRLAKCVGDHKPHRFGIDTIAELNADLIGRGR